MGDNNLKQYTDHFSKEYSPEILKFAEGIFPDYIFTRKIKDQQFGYCTACGNEFKTEGLKHKAKIKCPGCKEQVFVQSSGMKRSKMINEAYFIYYEKSIIDPEAIVARGVYAVEDYRREYRNVKPKLADRTLYVFKIGEAVMLKRYVWYSWSDFQFGSPCWGSMKYFEKASTIHSELSLWAQRNYVRGIACFSRKSIEKAVAGTPFQYSMWKNYDDEPMVKFFELFAQYPRAVEYLTKMGFESFIDAKLTGRATCGAVNWRGKTVFEMLRLNRPELRQLKGSGLILDPLYLRLFQINKKDKNGFNMLELKEVEREFGTNQVQEILKITKYTSLKKAFRYIKSQYDSCISKEGKRHFYSFQDTMGNYRDYINDCVTLEMDMKKDRVLFPKNLYTAHQNTIKQVKVTENKRLNEKIALRVPELTRKYYFEHSGLIIRPAKDSKELIDEGKALNHCVGTYAERYANGKTNILFIRKFSEPEKPFFTMEIGNDNKIIQTRGKGNCSPDLSVNKFVEVFTQKKLSKKENKIKISVPA